MKNKSWARENAVKALNKILREAAYSNIALKNELSNSDLSKIDKALVTEIVNGTLKNLSKIDWIIKQFTNNKKLDSWIEDIIRCGIYQILFLDRIPDSAVCNESSELARKLGHEGTVKFVNGVLRNISRNKDNIKYPDKEDNLVEYLSVYYSHPSWIVKKFIDDYGAAFTEEMLKANNQTPPFCIRTNSLKIDKNSLKEILEAEGIEVEEGLYNSEALHIRGTSSIEDKESFIKGYYQIQDESSMLVANIMNPKPGDFILDMCSAPGGKATHIAELMNNEGTIIARDIHEHKLRLIKASSKRLGISIIKTQLYNAKELDESLINKVDKVLLDAPCSGLGVIRRKPDLRYKKKQDNFNELTKLQLDILQKAGQYVKPQGILIYSTCTINKDENINVINKFIESNNEFYLESIKDLIPNNLKIENAEKGYLELYPNVNNTDGFFIARLRRK
jgi:16S rRNA (cytosine967-C5)-methyltransferase